VTERSLVCVPSPSTPAPIAHRRDDAWAPSSRQNRYRWSRRAAGAPKTAFMRVSSSRVHMRDEHRAGALVYRWLFARARRACTLPLVVGELSTWPAIAVDYGPGIAAGVVVCAYGSVAVSVWAGAHACAVSALDVP